MLEIPCLSWSEANIPGMSLLVTPHVPRFRVGETAAVSVHIPLTFNLCPNSSSASISFAPFLCTAKECQAKGGEW